MKIDKTFAMVFAVVAIPLFGVSSVTAAQAAEGVKNSTVSESQSETIFDLFRGDRKKTPEKEAAATQTKPAATRKAKAGTDKVVTTKRKAGRKGSGKAGKTGPATTAYHGLVSQFAREYGVPADLAHAVISVESNYYPKARGKAGEIGLMQIKPATARGMGYRGSSSGLYHPETNIKYGMKYLATAYKLGGGTTCGAILKYNAGHGAKRMNPTSSAYCAKVKRILGQ